MKSAIVLASLLFALPATAQTQAPMRVYNAGTRLTLRYKLNFTGTGVTCADNSSATRTDCTITAGSGGGGTVTADSPLTGDGSSGSHLACATCATLAGTQTLSNKTFSTDITFAASNRQIVGTTAAADTAGNSVFVVGAAGGVASSTGGGAGGAGRIFGGAGGASSASHAAGNGASAGIFGGAGGSDSAGGGGANGGGVTITGGAASTGGASNVNGGAVNINGGVKANSGANGAVNIGTTNAGAINLGTSGSSVAVTGNVTVTSGSVTAQGFVSNSSAPTCAAGNGPGGPGASCTVAGNNEAGLITLTYGSSAGAGSGTEFVVTLANSVACATKTVAHVYPADSATGTRFNMFNISNFTWVTGNTTTWTFNANAPVGVANGTYTYEYISRCY